MTVFFLLGSTIFLFSSFLIGLYRVSAGPTILDRILGFDAISVSVVGIIILIMVRENNPHFLEILLLFCLLSFTSAVAFMEYQLDLEEKL